MLRVLCLKVTFGWEGEIHLHHRQTLVDVISLFVCDQFIFTFLYTYIQTISLSIQPVSVENSIKHVPSLFIVIPFKGKKLQNQNGRSPGHRRWTCSIRGAVLRSRGKGMQVAYWVGSDWNLPRIVVVVCFFFLGRKNHHVGLMYI